METTADDPLAIAMDHAREVLFPRLARLMQEPTVFELGERLSSGKLVSERLDELLAEVEQRDLEPAEVILGSRAFQLYCKERRVYVGRSTQLRGGYNGLSVTRSDSEAAEYVAIECG
jgi:hypothetical protein